MSSKNDVLSLKRDDRKNLISLYEEEINKIVVSSYHGSSFSLNEYKFRCRLLRCIFYFAFENIKKHSDDSEDPKDKCFEFSCFAFGKVEWLLKKVVNRLKNNGRKAKLELSLERLGYLSDKQMEQVLHPLAKKISTSTYFTTKQALLKKMYRFICDRDLFEFSVFKNVIYKARMQQKIF